MPRGRAGRRARQPDPGIHNDGAVGAGNHRVAVELGDLRVGGGERGHPLDDVLHRSGVGERCAAESVKEGERAQLAQHGGRFAWTDRGQANLHVADQLRGRAAGADGDQRSEARITDHTDDQLRAGGRHPLNEESFRGHTGRLQRGLHLARGVLGAGRGEAEAHGAQVGFVEQVGIAEWLAERSSR